MTAYNVVRFRVKPGRDKEFVDMQQMLPRDKMKGLRKLAMIKTGDRTYCLIGEWGAMNDIVKARPDMIASLETAFDLNHAIGGERNTRVSLGAEWRPNSIISLRSGLQLGGRVDAAMAFGFGFRPVSWFSVDVATSELTSLFFADRRRLDLALGASLHARF